jgi:hypothetical protein
VGNIVRLGQNFETNRYLDGMTGSKPSKFEILDMHGSLTGEKLNPRPHPPIHGAGAGLTHR